MNIYNLTVSTIVAAMATLLALGGGTVQAATLCVNPRGTGTCFSSIQAAVDAAHDGDTIKVAPGTYAEQVMIDGKSVTIRGAGNGTIIRPSAPATLRSIYTYPAAGVFWPSAISASIIIVKDAPPAGVTIRDLKVDGANVIRLPLTGADRLAGILYGESAGTIRNVTVDSIKTAGYADRTHAIDLIAATHAVSVEIFDSRITDFARNGVVADGGRLTANLHDNIITGPPLAGTVQVPNGIVFISGAGGNAIGSTIRRLHYINAATSFRSVGIMMFTTDLKPVVIENNNVHDVDDGVRPSNGGIIRNNSLHGNGTGIVFESGALNNHVVNNSIRRNAHGIQINGVLNPNVDGQDPPGTGNVARNNCIVRNTSDGVLSYDNTAMFDATNNWWGRRSGPGGIGTGRGDSVGLYVDFTPWLLRSRSCGDEDKDDKDGDDKDEDHKDGDHKDEVHKDGDHKHGDHKEFRPESSTIKSLDEFRLALSFHARELYD